MTQAEHWNWSKEKYAVARLLAEGKRYREAAAAGGFADVTVRGWMCYQPEFKAYVNELTLENELTTRAGITRLLLRGIEAKEANLELDKDTMLSYLKMLDELSNRDKKTDNILTVTFN